MSSSVGTKAKKTQPSLSPATPEIAPSSPALEHALMALENACQRILESPSSGGRDPERSCSQHRLKNIATPVSLALNECKGPRRFHYHYRHRADDDAILHPVLEPSPIATVARVCASALQACQRNFTGPQDDGVARLERMLERALQEVLALHGEAVK